MGLECIPNQPIDFCTHVNQSCLCGPEGDYRLDIDDSDATEFQFNLTAAKKSIVADFSNACGVDWVCGAGWSIAANVASYSGAGAGLMTHTLATPLNTGVYHKLTFDINPTINSGASLIPQLGGNNIKQIGFNSITPGIWQTVSVYVYLNTKTTDTIVFNPGACPAFDIRNVDLEEMTTAKPVIEDADGNALYTFTPDAATFTGTTNVYPTPNIYQIDDAGVSNPIEIYYRADLCMVKILDWSLFGISYGCVQITIEDDVPAVAFTWTSNLLDYRASHECTLLLSWTADENAFGFNYTNLTFTQYARVRAKLRNPRYPYDDEEGYINSQGVGTIVHAFSQKIYEFTTELLPEFIHDALRIGMIHTDFQVDSVRMFKDEGDYAPNWENVWHLASVTIDLIQADPGRLNSMRRCSKVGVGGDAVGSTVVL